VDYVGALLLVAAFVPLLLVLSLGGHSFAWSSPQSLGLFAGAAAALVLFLLVEQRVSNPILPLRLFGNRVFTIANLAGFLISMAFLGEITFLPLYLQLGLGVAATTSGLAMLPLMAGLIVTSTIAGQLVSRIGRYKPFMIVGGVLLLIGIWLLSRVTVHTTLPDLCWRMAIVGLGLGPGQSLFNVASQNAVEVRDIGVATSTGQFFRQIGATMGVAMFGALLTHRLAHEGQGLDLGALQGLALRATATGAARHADPVLALALTHAITGVVTAGLVVVAAALAAILMIPELPLRGRQPVQPVLEKELA
jgi:uncharacterized membrane protein